MSEERAILVRLRQVIARELETINEYEQYADATDAPEVKALFQHLADEEKEHVTEVYEVLKKWDSVQAAWEEGAHVQAIRADRFGEALAAGESKHAPAAKATADIVATPPAPPTVVAAVPHVGRVPTRLTVGSLFGQNQG